MPWGYYAFGRELMNGNSVLILILQNWLSVHTLDIGLAGIEVCDILRDEKYDIQIESGRTLEIFCLPVDGRPRSGTGTLVYV